MLAPRCRPSAANRPQVENKVRLTPPTPISFPARICSGETLVMLGNFANNNAYPVTIDAGGTLEIMAGTSAEAATFHGAATLQLDNSQTYSGAIAGFGVSDVIDLADVHYVSNEYAVWTQTATTNGGSGTLKIYNGMGTLEAKLNLSGIYAQNQFALADDNTASHGTDVNFNYVSFSNGTINSNGNVTPQVSNAGSTLELTNGNSSEAASWKFDRPDSERATNWVCCKNSRTRTSRAACDSSRVSINP